MSSFAEGGGPAVALFALAFAFVFPITAHAQFEIEESHTTASLRGIANVGGGVAWASGTNGTVLRTEDGGYLWQTCSVPLAGTKDTAEKLDFRGIQAFDENTAIVMSSGPGDQSRLYKTTDGCQTWKLLFTNPDKDGFWDAISVTRNANGEEGGWILGDPVRGRFAVLQLKKYDGAEFAADNTTSLAADPSKAGAFAASNSSFFVLQDGPALPTGPLLPPPPAGTKRKDNYEMVKRPVEYFVTGGKLGARVFIRQPDWKFDFPVKEEWISLPVALGSGTDGSGAFSIALRDFQAGVIVGGDYTKPEASERTAVFRDATSKSWIPSQTPPHGYRSAVAYDAPTKTWITVGPNGTDISTDDGRNWRPLSPTQQDDKDADKNWNALSLPFVVGPHGRIGKLRPDALTPLSSVPKKPKTP